MINRAEQTMEQRLVKEVASTRKELEALKVKQIIGAENFNIYTSTEYFATVTLLANQLATDSVSLTFTGGFPVSLALPALRIRVDTDDAAHSLSTSYWDSNVGSALTSGQKNCDHAIYVARDGTSLITQKVINTNYFIRNFDSSSHTYYISTRWYILGSQ